MQDLTILDKDDRIILAVDSLRTRLQKVAQKSDNQTAYLLLPRLTMQSAREWTTSKSEYAEVREYLIELAVRGELL